MHRRFFLVDSLNRFDILHPVRPGIPPLLTLPGLFSDHDVTLGQPGRDGKTAGRLPGLPARVAYRNFPVVQVSRVLVVLTISLQQQTQRRVG